MQINVTFGPHASGAPAGFEAAVEAAVQFYDRTIANPISVNINFDYGFVNGEALTAPDGLGVSQASGYDFTYAEVKSFLTTLATTADDQSAVASLPSSDPTDGGVFFVTTGLAKAAGLFDGGPSDTDGWIGVDSAQLYTTSVDARAVSGRFDLVGVLEHEISEVLGRYAFSGSTTALGDGGTPGYAPMDLFRYVSNGVLALTPEAGYFSIDGGHTALLEFNDPHNGGDAGDWASSAGNDAYDASSLSGVENPVSLTDLRVLDVLGYTLATPTENDFGSAGVSDLLLENLTGSVYIGNIVGGHVNYTAVSGLGPEWTIVGEGNYLGDSYSEFAIHNLNGALDIGEVVNGAAQYTQIGAVGSEWQFEGSGYFQDTQYSELLMKNATGSLDIAEVINGQAVYTSISAVGPEWQFEGVGNFLGDAANAEFLMHNATSGSLVLGQVVNGQAIYTTIGGVGPEWSFGGVGDFLNESRDEFLMRSATTGALVLGDMNNGVLTYETIGSVGPEWRFIDAGDYSGAGVASFLMENATGAIVIGTVVSGVAQYQTVSSVGPEWSIFGDGAGGHLA